MDKLYYFYCFDQGYRSFRITNYFNYCSDALTSRGCPACIEYWTEPGDSTEESVLIKNALRELREFGVIDETYELKFSKAEKGSAFPIPSIKNLHSLNQLRKKIKDKGIKNLLSVGIMAEENLFFISDVLKDAYSKVVLSRN